MLTYKCPHCSNDVLFDGSPGATLNCPSCGHSFVAGSQPPPPPPPLTEPAAERLLAEIRDELRAVRTEIQLWGSGNHSRLASINSNVTAIVLIIILGAIIGFCLGIPHLPAP